MSEWLPTHADLSSSLLNQSIRNPKGKGVANKDRKSAADSSNNSLSPCAVSQGSRKQCQDERNPKLPRPMASRAEIARSLDRRQASNPACRCNRPATHRQEARKIRLRFQKEGIDQAMRRA